MKQIFFITILLFVTNYAYPQIKISIDSVYITQVIDTLPIHQGIVMNDIDEDWGKGPWVRVYATFENFTNDTIYLDNLDYVMQESENTNLDSLTFIRNTNGGISLTFSYEKKIYEVDPDPLSFIPGTGQRKKLNPTKKQTISFGTHILFGTDFYKESWRPEGLIYFKEIIEIIPTLQVMYTARDGSIYRSCGIKNVIYKE